MAVTSHNFYILRQLCLAQQRNVDLGLRFCYWQRLDILLNPFFFFFSFLPLVCACVKGCEVFILLVRLMMGENPGGCVSLGHCGGGYPHFTAGFAH